MEERVFLHLLVLYALSVPSATPPIPVERANRAPRFARASHRQILRASERRGLCGTTSTGVLHNVAWIAESRRALLRAFARRAQLGATLDSQ